MQLEGRTALVTGASKGIGLAVVRGLVAEGVRVVAAARTITPELTDTGAHAVPVDLSTPDGPDTLVRAATEHLGDLDVLVNNVGGGDVSDGVPAGFLDVDDKLWEVQFNLNLFATIRTTRAALPGLLRTRGSVINVSSIGALMPSTGPITYTTAKAALNAFGKALNEEFAPRGVRVNTVSPGPTRTGLILDPDGYGGIVAGAMGVPVEQLADAMPAAMGIAIGRLVEPEEVAGLVVHLASPRGAGISGANLLVDGGTVKSV